MNIGTPRNLDKNRNNVPFGVPQEDLEALIELIINKLIKKRGGFLLDGMQEVIGSTPIFSTQNKEAFRLFLKASYFDELFVWLSLYPTAYWYCLISFICTGPVITISGLFLNIIASP
ncbi:hypothetical protein ACFQ3S_10940 [Mucilaginibacter terrae]|uniref:hypothetical protein n=1 Tax=Mucilaginibacter terrae TaxID=1955052 RepID=UPI00363198F1